MKLSKRMIKIPLIATTALVLALVAGYFAVSSQTDTYLGRWFAWKASDIEDYKKFPKTDIRRSEPQFDFEVALDSDFGEQKYKYKDGEETLDTILSKNDTTAFIVIKDDQILYEEYFNGYERDSINTSFSVAKSITSLLVGAAIDDGAIKDVNDPVTNYLPQLEDVDPRYEQVTIDHLLSMKSGIQFADHDLPWGDKPKAYYHPDLRSRVMELKITETPGDRFQYNTYNPIILGMVLEEATGKSVPEYFEEKYWSRMGMEFDGSWSMDSEAGGMTKMESGINSRAIDFAKFGRLILAGGNWEGEQLISEEWVTSSTEMRVDNLATGYGEDLHYNRGWWLTDSDAEGLGSIAGWGHLGQYLYVFPDKNIVIVRFGKDMGDVESWPALIEEVAATIE